MPLSMREKKLLAERMERAKERYDELMAGGETKSSATMIVGLEMGVSEAAVRRYLKVMNSGEEAGR